MSTDDSSISPLGTGEVGRYYCGKCLLEYEVTLEPSYAYPGGPEVLGAPPRFPLYCPFCGRTNHLEQR